jgi:hypothetical protein
MATLSGAIRRAGTLVSRVAFSLALFVCAAAGPAASVVVTAPVVRYAGVLRSFNPQLSAPQSQDMAAHVLWLSSYYDLDPRLLIALVGAESSWHAAAVSPAGAQGLGQLMPSTAGGLHVLSFDAYENLDGTARYLRRMLQRFSDRDSEARTELALASYNAGPQAVARSGGIPPYAETRAYVTRVMELWRSLRLQLPSASAPAPVLALARAAPRPTAIRRPPVVRRAPALPGGSVAAFTQLEVESLQVLAAASIPTAFPAPPGVRKPRGLRGWLARAFGTR